MLYKEEAFSTFAVKLYDFCLSFVYIAHLYPYLYRLSDPQMWFSPGDGGRLAGFPSLIAFVTKRYRCVVRASAVPKLYVLCVWEVEPGCIGSM